MVNALGYIKEIKHRRGDDKLRFLYSIANLPDAQSTLAVLRFIYNPYVKTGISNLKLINGKHYDKLKVEPTYSRILEYYNEHQTGNSTDVDMAWRFINSFDDYDVRDLVAATITQDLQCGVSTTSLNKVFGRGFIPIIGCMLGKRIDKIPRVNWPVIVTEKLDGVRRLAFNEGSACRFYSRSGHEYQGHDEIAEEIVKYLPSGYMYDGELVAKGEYKDIIAQRQATMALSACKGTKTGLTFHIFDMVPIHEVTSGQFKESALQRKIRLGSTFYDAGLHHIDKDWQMHFITLGSDGAKRDAKHIAAVPILALANHEQQIEPIVAEMRHNGREGVMLNVATAPYKMGRTSDLVKVKFVKEYKLQVVGFIEGQHKYEGTLGALVVDYYGYNVGVGSGFADYDRDFIWNNRDKLVGQYVEVDSFGESTSLAGGKSLNCPIFKRWVGDEE